MIRFNTLIPLLILLGVLSPPAMAADTLGFHLGTDTEASAITTLTTAHATFDDRYAYKGDGRLPIINVTAYAPLTELGTLRNAWLKYRPDGVLYLLIATWRDAGSLYRTLKDALDIKYSTPRTTGFGFKTRHVYQHKNLTITLKRNAFGFGSQQTTTLIYVHRPSLPVVEKMQATIEADQRKRNHEKIGGQL